MNKEIGLVLEGGGFRGCYIAGCLKWLYDNNIIFNYTVAMSASTAFAFFYLTGDMATLHKVSVEAIKDPGFIGLPALIREQGIVGFNQFRDKYVIEPYKKELPKLLESDNELEVGLYDLEDQQIKYFGKNTFDQQASVIKASCILPISAKAEVINGKKYIDGGTDTMVAIQRSLDTGHKKNLIIVTKDKNYVRKPNNYFLSKALHVVYHKYDKMLEVLDNRPERYYKEMNLVYDLVDKSDALLIRPTRDCGVKRFTGSRKQLEEMFMMGYQDMEDQKEAIYKFLEIKKS